MSEDEIRDLAGKLSLAGLNPKTQIAMWLMHSCCCRISEVIQTRWEHFDFDKREWVIPKEHSKNGRAHTIYLTDFALDQFTALKKQADSEVWCFQDTTGKTFMCPKSTTKQKRDRQMAGQGGKPVKNRAKNADALLLTSGDWVPHDLRRTGATLMQSIKIAPVIIERVLNHVESSKLIRTHQT